MTQPLDAKYTIRACDAETTAEADLAISGLVSRARAEGNLPLSVEVHPRRPELNVNSKVAAERVINNSRVNREDRGEAFIECAPELAALPARHP